MSGFNREILDHVWGESPAADRVWAQVSGLGSRSGGRILMVLQAFMDESYTDKTGTYVIGGCVADAATWAAFSTEWERLLPRFGRVDADGKRHFHMTEMRNMEEVMFFYRALERYAPVYLSARINKADVERALSRVYVQGAIMEWAPYDDPYYVAFRCLVDRFHLERKNIPDDVLPKDQTIDFYFDDNSSKVHVRNMWERYMEERPPEVRRLYGAEPRFENDRDFLPLQAADLWAWWVRKWVDDGTPENILKHDFGAFKRNSEPKHPTLDIVFNEDDLMPTLERLARANSGDHEVIIFPIAPPKPWEEGPDS